MDSRPTAGVVGAGIAGLSAAVALRRAGWNVEVFEKSRMQHETGAAITLMTIATAILDKWGFDFKKAQGVPNQRITILNAADWTTLSHYEYTDLKQEYGHDSLFFHRVDLHHGLVELATRAKYTDCKAGPPVVVKVACPVERIDCENGVLTLTSGESFTKDLLVLADGAHSHLFAQFTGQPDPIDRIGRSIYRILLERSKVDELPGAVRFLTSSPNALPGFCIALDPIENAHLVCYPCSDSKMLNFAIVHDTKQSPTKEPSADTSWIAPSSLSDVLETTHNFHPELRSIIELAANDDIKVHHAMHRPSLNSFIRGKCVILGDAAHMMLPIHAAGASISVESAGVLEILMQDIVDPTPSFPPTPTQGSPTPGTPKQTAVKSPLLPQPSDSASSSTQDLIVGAEKRAKSALGAKSTSNLNLTTPAPPAVTVTSSEADATPEGKVLPSADTEGEGEAPPLTTDDLATVDSKTSSSNAPQCPLTSSLISRSLTLFDSLRVPRCTAFQLLSNGGFMSQNNPSVVEQIRRHGFEGPLPGPKEGPWSEGFIQWYFGYDAIAEANKAMERGIGELSP